MLRLILYLFGAFHEISNALLRLVLTIRDNKVMNNLPFIMITKMYCYVERKKENTAN